MTMSIRIFVCLLALAASCAGDAAAQFRKYSNEFLNIGAGARGLAMGGAQVAVADDGTAGYWNPAGLMEVKDRPILHLMHAGYFSGIGKYDYASAALPATDGRRALGVTLLRFAIDDIPNTLYLVEPDGTINYNNIRSFSSADYAFLLSYAQRIVEEEHRSISFGVNAKVIHRSVGSFARAWGFGLDAGLRIRWHNWRLGATLRDVTTTFNAWSFSFTEREKEVLYLTKNDIPVKSTELTAPRLILGFARDLRIGDRFRITPEMDLDFTFDGKRNVLLSGQPVSIDPRLGIEAGYRDVIMLRAGISNFQQGLKDGDTLNVRKAWIFQPSLGAGFRWSGFSVDYAFSNLANQSNPLYSHVFSLRVPLGRANRNPIR
ncbi:MAG: PorV/PorQ family protein [bacterium]|nr:PorV/PorQ family protein [Chitinophagaceae bacterium]